VTRFVFNFFIMGLIIAVLLAAGLTAPLQAQTGALRLEGVVWDPSGNPLSGVQLTAIAENTGLQYEIASDRDGYYRFLELQPGLYTVTAKLKGFKDVTHRHINLYTPGSTSENFTFEISSAIDREIGPITRFRLLDSETASSFSQRDIDALPLLNHDPLSLLIYQPGVQINGGNEGVSTFNGTRQTMNALRLDGLSIADPIDPTIGSSPLTIVPDAISDLQVIPTGGYAEFGGSGGAQFVVVSRPGSKKWSGDVYDYARNKRLNANDYFNNGFGIPRPQMTRNIFGASVSGPAADKTLLFANFEGNITNQQIPRNRLVLTATAKTPFATARQFKPLILWRTIQGNSASPLPSPPSSASCRTMPTTFISGMA